MTPQAPITGDEVADVLEAPADKLLRLMARKRRRDDARDAGNLLGMGAIKQMFGSKDGEMLRGLLIKLVARGDVEAIECVNGMFWRAYIAPVPVTPHPDSIADGVYILQRQIPDDPRGLWFDAETFVNRNRALAALKFAEWQAENDRRNYGRNACQRVRLISPVSAATAARQQGVGK